MLNNTELLKGEKKSLCRSPSGMCDQSTCIVSGRCEWPECDHKYEVQVNAMPELVHFKCPKCGHIPPQ